MSHRALPLLALALSTGACQAAGGGPDGSPFPVEDATVPVDQLKLPPPPADGAIDSGCPAPGELAPIDVPPGYLPATVLPLDHAVDGDTAVFLVAGMKQGVRFLFVNTEESSGADTTAFGTQAKGVVGGWLQGAREIAVSARESTTKPGMPTFDTFGRWLALVFIDGELIETRIVREGWSPYFTEYGCAEEPVHSNLLWAEAEAFAAGRGVFAPGHPTSYREVITRWIGTDHCRPNPYFAPYCF